MSESVGESDASSDLSPTTDPSSSHVKKLLRKTGIDRAIGTTILTRVGQSLSALLLMSLVATRLSPVEQGYYMVFAAIVALQVFFELGLTFVILQFSSHEVARLTQDSDGTYHGDVRSKARLSSLLQFGVRWYSVASILLLAVVLPGGFWFFLTSHRTGLVTGWQLPWTLLVVATSCTLITNSVIAVFEGCGHVSEVASLRLRETLIGTGFAALLLLFGAGLYALAALVVCDASVEVSWLFRRRVTIRDLWRSYDSGIVVRWKTEVWPFQWKIAISWISGYFIFQIFNPIAFRVIGPVEAGQIGLTAQACNGITMLAFAWISTKAPKMGSLVSLGKRTELDSMFFRAAKTSLGVALFMALGFWCVVALLQHQLFRPAFRFVEPMALGLMLTGCVANCVCFAEAQYLRAHKVEPFLVLSVVSAIVNLVLVVVLAQVYGVRGIAAGYACTTLVVGLGGGTYVFVRNRKRWVKEFAGGMEVGSSSSINGEEAEAR